MNKSMDAGVDGRWMSYAELAKIRRIDKTSALRLALRHGWPRRKSNSGRMQVCVPLEWAEPPERLQGLDINRGTDKDIDKSVDLSMALAAYQDAKIAFSEALKVAEARADRAEAMADRAQQALDQERKRADGLQHRLDIALQVTHELRRAEDARRGLSLLWRLRAAWRGE
jgi:hypothetical protein